MFLFPWAVRYRALGWFVAEVAGFLATLIVGYVWACKKARSNGYWDGKIGIASP